MYLFSAPNFVFVFVQALVAKYLLYTNLEFQESTEFLLLKNMGVEVLSLVRTGSRSCI